jgi:hypothetical protein
MEKARPTSSDVRLTVRGHFAAFRTSLPGEVKETEYTLIERGRRRPLADVQWADWDAQGRLLVATRDGRLQIRKGRDFSPSVDVDLAALSPTPSPPPVEASRW